mgnify:CR=1 FL=1
MRPSIRAFTANSKQLRLYSLEAVILLCKQCVYRLFPPSPLWCLATLTVAGASSYADTKASPASKGIIRWWGLSSIDGEFVLMMIV